MRGKRRYGRPPNPIQEQSLSVIDVSEHGYYGLADSPSCHYEHQYAIRPFR